MNRLIFWDFPRASWQYDVVVGLILAFIFLTPRAFFKDQPRPSSIVQMPSDEGARTYWFETGLLDNVPEKDRRQKAADLLNVRYGKRLNVVRVEAFYDAEEELRGYMAVVKP